jgi:hypothetical protein
VPIWGGAKQENAVRAESGAALARAIIRATSWDFDLRHCGRRDQLDNRNARPRAIASVINPHGSIRILLEDRRKAAIPVPVGNPTQLAKRREKMRLFRALSRSLGASLPSRSSGACIINTFGFDLRLAYFDGSDSSQPLNEKIQR